MRAVSNSRNTGRPPTAQPSGGRGPHYTTKSPLGRVSRSVAGANVAERPGRRGEGFADRALAWGIVTMHRPDRRDWPVARRKRGQIRHRGGSTLLWNPNRAAVPHANIRHRGGVTSTIPRCGGDMRPSKSPAWAGLSSWANRKRTRGACAMASDAPALYQRHACRPTRCPGGRLWGIMRQGPRPAQPSAGHRILPAGGPSAAGRGQARHARLPAPCSRPSQSGTTPSVG